MNVSGEISVRAEREAVFDKLQDARFFASCIEGVSELTEIDPTHYTATLETKIAYLRFKFRVMVEASLLDRPSRIEAKIEGTPLGVVGRLTATSATTLSEDGDETRIAYSVDLSLTGKLGSLGQPVLKSKAKEMERQFAANLRAAFAQPAEAAS
jgi:uncharacterized protein